MPAGLRPWRLSGLQKQVTDTKLQGCDGSVLLDGPNTEKHAPINAKLIGFEVVDAAKAAVEAVCPGIVSCADIIAYAARDSTVKLTASSRFSTPELDSSGSSLSYVSVFGAEGENCSLGLGLRNFGGCVRGRGYGDEGRAGMNPARRGNRVGTKRGNERRLSLLRRSLDLDKYIKRPCHQDPTGKMSGPSRPSPVHQGNPHQSSERSGGIRRGILFGDPGASTAIQSPLLMRHNAAFERAHQPSPRWSQSAPGTNRLQQRSHPKSTTPAQNHLEPDGSDPPSLAGSGQRATSNAHISIQSGGTSSPWGSVDPIAGTLRQQPNNSCQREGDEDMQGEQEGERSDEGGSEFSKSEAASDADDEELKTWRAGVRKEATEAFSKLPQLQIEQDDGEIEVEHVFDFSAQLRIQARKQHLEACGIVFCTVDMSPSRDSFCQWLYQEVESKSAVQIRHVKVLAPRHYLVCLWKTDDRDTVMASGPYYMKRRMVYTVHWEPGFDTTKTLAKKMAVWLDLQNVDPVIESEGKAMLATLGEVIQIAGTTTELEGKFAHVRGCVLMDMTKPLPTVMRTVMDGEIRKVKIQYDLLPDACFVCHERGHYQRFCPKLTTTKPAVPTSQAPVQDPNEFQPVERRRGNPNRGEALPKDHLASANPFAVLGELGELDEATKDPENSNNNLTSSEGGQDNPHQQTNATPDGGGATGAEDIQTEPEKTALPDLNASPATKIQEQSEAKQLEKIKKKEKKKAKKEERRRIRAGLLQPTTEAVIVGANSTEHSEADAEQSDSEEEGGPGFWKSIKEKKAKVGGETMDASISWVASPTRGNNNLVV
ncbi:hypothetical protein R1sor_011856 [Riccia sorocarpa]|uniref:Peroxidase n=1 Tax=Riccia sorocarpa TaxID=122646 RepID=A0ABD3I5Q4_9MARC